MSELDDLREGAGLDEVAPVVARLLEGTRDR